MPKKEPVNKTQVVREYIKAHPGAGNTEISEALTKQGVKLSPQHVANIKSKIKAKRTARTAAAKAATTGAPVAASTQPVADQPKATNAITLEQIKKVAQTVKTIGGFDRLRELLDIVREVGGLKKFKDLLDAMSVTETDSIPY